jgi:hypothetical protein
MVDKKSSYEIVLIRLLVIVYTQKGSLKKTPFVAFV